MSKLDRLGKLGCPKRASISRQNRLRGSKAKKQKKLSPEKRVERNMAYVPDAPDQTTTTGYETETIMRRMQVEADALVKRGATTPLVDLPPFHCPYVIGEPALALCCGVRNEPGFRWCLKHARRVYQSGHAEPDNEIGDVPPVVIPVPANDDSAPVVADEVRTEIMADAL
jgi:hypothetical protein